MFIPKIGDFGISKFHITNQSPIAETRANDPTPLIKAPEVVNDDPFK